MQDRYVGDIGDYLKLAILRALSPGRRLGVAWWLHPDGGAVGDGRHTNYLQAGLDWRHHDPPLFDFLGEVMSAGNRKITALQDDRILPGAVFFPEQIPILVAPASRPAERAAWFARAKTSLSSCDLVFADPDNGIEPARYQPTMGAAGKSITWNEIAALRAPGRALVIYHHQSRFKGGHLDEIAHLAKRFRERGFDSADALRASPYSPRVFFLLDGSSEMRSRAEQLGRNWDGKISWHPDPGAAT